MEESARITEGELRVLADRYCFPAADVIAAFNGEKTRLAAHACKQIAEQVAGDRSPRRRGEALCAWAKRARTGNWRRSTYASGGPAKTVTHEEIVERKAKRGEEWPKFSPEQAMRAIERLERDDD